MIDWQKVYLALLKVTCDEQQTKEALAFLFDQSDVDQAVEICRLEVAMKTILFLVFAHYLCDFGLQNDFIAKFKAPQSAPFWFHVMIGHCSMHALGVLLITQNPRLAIAEFCAHFVIDYFKCKQRLSFNQDQSLHILCKLAWWGLL